MRWRVVIFFQMCYSVSCCDGAQEGCINSSTITLDSTSHRNTNRSCSKQPASFDSQLLQGSEEYATFSPSSLPQLFALDHYDRCMSRQGGVYCVLDLSLANEPGLLYDYIKEYSSITQKRYNRANIHRGVCVNERCGLDVRAARNGDQLLACMNNTIYQESGLQVSRVKVRNCYSADEKLPPADSLDWAVAGLVATLLFLVASGTLHHLLHRAGIVKENRYAVAFSLVNNWRILKSGSGGSGEENFDSLQGMRLLTMLLNISAHVFLLFAHGFVANPEFIEELYEDPFTVWIMNGRVIVQTFFVMSGFLLAHHVLKNAHTKPITLDMLPSAFFNRAIRLLPSALMVMALMATWVPRSGSGPLWHLSVAEERDICREHWWKQLLFIQNYFHFDKICLPQSWYIATDTQLYLIGFLVLVAICRYESIAWLIFGAVLTTSVIVPAVHTYVAHLVPIRASFFPETFLKLFVGNATFLGAYVSAQGNWAGHTLGMITAYAHYQAERNGWKLHKSQVLKCLYRLSVPVGCATVWFGAEYHTRPATRLEAALFNALDHNVFALAMCIFILGCIYKYDSVMRGIVEWAPLQPLGRLSLCALLLHTVVLRTYIGHLPDVMYASFYNITFIVVSTIVLTYICSLLLFLFVEQPACQLQKIVLGVDKKIEKRVDDRNGCHRVKKAI